MVEGQGRIPGRDVVAALAHGRAEGLERPSPPLSGRTPRKGKHWVPVLDEGHRAGGGETPQERRQDHASDQEEEDWGTTFMFADADGNEFRVIAD